MTIRDTAPVASGEARTKTRARRAPDAAPRIGALGVFAVLYLAFIYAPVLFIPLFSFNDSTYIAFPLSGFTTEWYVTMSRSDGLVGALTNSIKVATPAAVVSTLLGTLAAKAVTRYRMPGMEAVVSFIMSPLVVPAIIVGVALLIIVNAIGIELSLFTVFLAHLPPCTAFAMWIMISRLEGFDAAIEEASRDLGEGPWMTFWRVTFPLIVPGVVASLLLTFTISFDEYVLASFLGGSEPTLPIYIYSQLRFPWQLPNVLALATILLFASFALVYIAMRFRNRGVQFKTTTGV